MGCHNLHTAPPTETQRRADNMKLTIAEAAGVSIINRLPAETLVAYTVWLDSHIYVAAPKGDIAVDNNIVLGND